MKKRLLITSIVMMLVVAVALSTATYAWFTSSTTVTSSSISLTAATNEEASLGISWVDGNYGPQITAASPQNGSSFSPASPETLTIGTTTSEVDFYTAKATPSSGDMIFKSGSIATTSVYTWTDDTLPANAATAHKSFFLKNLSPSNPIDSITVTATISNALVRVGIFRKDGNDYKLLGVLANKVTNSYTAVTGTMDGSTEYYKLYLGKYVEATIAIDDGVEGTTGEAAQVTAKTADYYNGMTAPEGKFFTQSSPDGGVDARAAYGVPVANDSVNAMTTAACTTGIQLLDVSNDEDLDAGDTIELVVLVWEDAVALGDAEGGTATTVSLSFGA